MKIAIDGTAASGKGTLSDNLSKELKLPRLDTGLLYRKLAFMYIKSLKLIPTQNTIDNSILKSILNDFDLNDLEPETLKQDLYGNFASRIGKLDFVRNKLKIIQIEFVKSMMKKKGGCILDGRDIGTEILPNADFKFYIDAPIETRAKRRFKQLYLTNKSIEFKDILLDLEKRDNSDKSRKNSPLIISEDSIFIDTEFLNPQQVLKKALYYVKKNK
jgi:cytidylate kinase